MTNMNEMKGSWMRQAKPEFNVLQTMDEIRRWIEPV